MWDRWPWALVIWASPTRPSRSAWPPTGATPSASATWACSSCASRTSRPRARPSRPRRGWRPSPTSRSTTGPSSPTSWASSRRRTPPARARWRSTRTTRTRRSCCRSSRTTSPCSDPIKMVLDCFWNFLWPIKMVQDCSRTFLPSPARPLSSLSVAIFFWFILFCCGGCAGAWWPTLAQSCPDDWGGSLRHGCTPPSIYVVHII
mmetsp:Transcript_2332/g.3944  ORF Transcript_2332/g.3944 Transcript_2332/m.3944 type:complete len:204 (-) Transcript_2332:168-779(-)